MEHKQIRTGSPVSWDWGKGTAKGKVKEIYRQTITKEIKGDASPSFQKDGASVTAFRGHQITRQGSESNPAYLIEQEDQTQVLKLRSELNQG